MKIGSMQSAVFLILASLIATPLLAASYYPVRLDDPTAVYLTPDKFPVHGDGVADDSAAIQQAIDQVESTTKQGIVFIPSGRYRITKTIYVWPAVRVIGYGPTRPVFVLGKNTPGLSAGHRLHGDVCRRQASVPSHWTFPGDGAGDGG